MIADNQGFPQIGSPIAQQGSLTITQPWYQVIIALWNRTGGSENAVGQGIFSGDVRAYAGIPSTVPQGWLLCDGSAVSRTKFKALFRAIGTTWGNGDGATTFNLPNAQDRVIIGAGNLYPLGSTGGSASVTLTTPNLPAHNHAVDDPGHTHTFDGDPHNHTITDPGHHHSTQTPGTVASIGSGTSFTVAVTGNTGNATTGITINNTTATGTNSNEKTGITTEDTGSGTAVNILPPYAAMLAIIKT